MPLFTWSSLAGGFFSGRFRPDNLDTFTAYLDKLCVQSYCYDENFARYARAEELAQQRGVSVPQLALAYVLSQPWNVFTLVGCANGAEFAVNAAALDLHLTEQELAWLERGDRAAGNGSRRGHGVVLTVMSAGAILAPIGRRRRKPDACGEEVRAAPCPPYKERQ